jgi:hypothetical protein
MYICNCDIKFQGKYNTVLITLGCGSEGVAQIGNKSLFTSGVYLVLVSSVHGGYLFKGTVSLDIGSFLDRILV